MSPGPRVVVVGEALALQDGWERLPCAAIASLQPHPRTPVLALLGDDAIETIPPPALLRAFRSGMHVVLVPESCGYARVVEWARQIEHDTARREDLAGTVAALLKRGVGARARLAPPEWWPTPVAPGSAAWEMLEVIPELARCLSVKDWAARMGWSTQLLWELCTKELEMKPLEILFLHVEAQVERARRRGYTVDAVAKALGYAGAASLDHAYSRRGRLVPKRPR